MGDPSDPVEPRDIEAEVVNLGGATLEQVEAEVVHIQQGGANRINASSVDMHQGGAFLIQSEELNIHQGVSVVSNSGKAVLESSSAGALLADTVNATNSRLGIAISNRAQLENSSPVILLAREVEGDVKPILDTRGALLAGLVSGVVVAAMLLIGSFVRRR